MQTLCFTWQEDPAWQRFTVVLSGPETPGEGEHKIMDYIRKAKALIVYVATIESIEVAVGRLWESLRILQHSCHLGPGIKLWPIWSNLWQSTCRHSQIMIQIPGGRSVKSDSNHLQDSSPCVSLSQTVKQYGCVQGLRTQPKRCSV